MEHKVSLRHLLQRTIGPVLDRWDRRPFPRDAKLRVLLVAQQHRLAKTQFEAFRRYRRRFGAIGIHFRTISYDALVAGASAPAADCIFLQSTYTPPSGELEDVLRKLRTTHPDAAISYFDWFAPTDVRFAERVGPWVDHYVKKSLLRDRDAYLQPTIGHTNLSDYFSAALGCENPARDWTVPAGILPKLIVGPAFSTGKDLIKTFEGPIPSRIAPRPIDVHARIAVNGTPWYSAMRRQAAAAIAAIPGISIVNAGLVRRRDFLKELAHSKIVFSPFGYGEICWRDFEAIAHGAVLIKPDMDHIEADPNIYQPFETYVPTKWDLSDLEEQIRMLLDDPALMERIAAQAFSVAREHLSAPHLEEFVMRLSKRAAA